MTSRSRKRLHNRGGSRFSPTSLADLAAWYRADLGVTLSGGTVSAWADQSGNGRHITQGTAARQPTPTTAAGLGGRDVISFDGNDALSSSAFTLPHECSVFFVLGSVTSRGMICEHGFGTNWYVYSTGNAAFFCLSHNTFQNPVTTWAQANQQGSAIYTRTAHATLRGNRADLTPTSTSGSSPGAADTNAILTVGNRQDFSLPHNGEIAEVFIYSRAVSAAELALIESYLLSRYGV